MDKEKNKFQNSVFKNTRKNEYNRENKRLGNLF